MPPSLDHVAAPRVGCLIGDGLTEGPRVAEEVVGAASDWCPHCLAEGASALTNAAMGTRSMGEITAP